MDYTVHGILQARILEWVAFPFSRAFSQPRSRTRVSCIAGGFFTRWATREALEGLSKATFEKKKEDREGVNHTVMCAENFPGRGDARYKGLEEEVFVVCSRKNWGQYGLSSEQESVTGGGAWEPV